MTLISTNTENQRKYPAPLRREDREAVRMAFERLGSEPDDELTAMYTQDFNLVNHSNRVLTIGLVMLAVVMVLLCWLITIQTADIPLNLDFSSSGFLRLLGHVHPFFEW